MQIVLPGQLSEVHAHQQLKLACTDGARLTTVSRGDAYLRMSCLGICCPPAE